MLGPLEQRSVHCPPNAGVTRRHEFLYVSLQCCGCSFNCWVGCILQITLWMIFYSLILATQDSGKEVVREGPYEKK